MCITVLSVQKFHPISQIENKDLDSKFKIFSFAINDSSSVNIKSAFFAKNAHDSFLKLKETSNILFASSASFVSSINTNDNIPVGFCAEKGEILNKMPHQSMDGLVIVNGDHPEINTINIIDLDKESETCESETCNFHFIHNNIRNNPLDTFSFLNEIKTHKISSFQTQLVFTKYKSDEKNFEKLNNGTNDRNRRFLTICRKEGVLHHVIVDSIEEDYLMTSAKNTLDYLRQLNYEVDFMVNLDTGSKDIIHAYNGEYLQNLRPNSLISSAKIENASSLLVYYTEI